MIGYQMKRSNYWKINQRKKERYNRETLIEDKSGLRHKNIMKQLKNENDNKENKIINANSEELQEIEVDGLNKEIRQKENNRADGEHNILPEMHATKRPTKNQ